MTTEPRTDVASLASQDPLELMKTSQQLERELAASKAEVAELTSLILDLELLQPSQQLERELAASKAEVERLRSTMRSFILVSPIEFERMEKIKAEVERHLNAMKRLVKPEDIN